MRKFILVMLSLTSIFVFKNDVFALIIIIKQMLKDDEVTNFILEIRRLFDNLEYNIRSIPITKVYDRMGFPTNWEDLAKIDKKVFE